MIMYNFIHMMKKPTFLHQKFLLICFLLSINALMAQSITGRVTDEKGEALPDVSIGIKGTTKGTYSDMNGNFKIDVASDGVLIFNSIGYISQSVVVGLNTNLEISLKPDNTTLDEVVVVGYSTQKKKDLTGAIASADLVAFKESPNVSIIQSLKGALPGLTIGQTNRAGDEPSINIRGTSTLNGNTSPLIIVDGLIFGGRLSDINPSDVASVDVLKDPSSKAIYGSQAANGVVLITTKSGKSSTKSSITYSSSYAISSPTVNSKLLRRDAFLEKIKDINYLTAFTPASGYTVPNPAWTFANSELFPVSLAGANSTNDFDWYGGLTQDALITNHSLAISGGSDKTNFYMSGGYTNDKGIIKNDNYSRYTARINLDTEVTKWLTVGAATSASFTNFSKDSPDMNSIVGTSPLVDPKDANGNYRINPIGDFNVNPFLNAENNRYEVQSRLVGNVFAIVRVPGLPGFSYRANFGNNLKFFKNYVSSIYGAGQTGSASKSDATSYEQTFDNIFNYTKNFGKHNINATGVYGYNTSEYDRTQASGTGFADLNLSYNSLQQAEIQKISSEAWKESLLYQMGSVAYSYASKYLIKATVRRDGFSGFSENNKTGIFPSLGIGWVISEENFMKQIPVINYLKLRASYGENGNKVARYSSLARVTANDASKYVFGDGGLTAIGRSVTSLANSDLKWERTRGINIGLDFSILKNRIDGNVEYYNSDTYDLLWEKVLPQTSGFSSVFTNIGQLNNTGIELMLHAAVIKTTDFLWDVTVNFTKNNNKVVKLLGLDANKDGLEDDLIASGLFIGKPIGTIYGYETQGVYQLTDNKLAGYSAGTYRLNDLNGDGKITAADDRMILGNTEPAFLMGMQNTLSYKQFTLRAFINSIQGGESSYLASNAPTGYNGTPGQATNSNWFDFTDFWSPRNPNSPYATPWIPVPAGGTVYQQRNFVRLQDISLSYSLTDKTAKKIGVANAKLFVSGKNLVTVTNWKGWDPEVGLGLASYNAFPVLKSYSVGLEITF